MERLDKILSEAGACTRRECDRLTRRGLIKVDGLIVRDSSEKISDSAEI